MVKNSAGWLKSSPQVRISRYVGYKVSSGKKTVFINFHNIQCTRVVTSSTRVYALIDL